VLDARFSLLDAQFLIAREYGFSDWPDLERHVKDVTNGGAATLDAEPDALAGAGRISASARARDFDYHAPSGLLAVCYAGLDGSRVDLLDAKTRTQIGSIGEEHRPFGPRISPDGEKIVFTNGKASLSAYSVREGTTNELPRLAGRRGVFASWSPDGASILFGAPWERLDPDKRPSAFELRLAEQRIVQLTSDHPGADAGPQRSPSGRRLVVNRRHYEPPRKYGIVLIGDADGTAMRTLPIQADGTQAAGRLCWSRDSRHILVAGAHGESYGTFTLTAFDVADFSVVWEIEDDVRLGGCFDPYRDRVLCATEQSLTLYAFPSGKAISTLDLSSLPLELDISGPRVAFGLNGEVYFLADGGLYRWDGGLGYEPVLVRAPEPAIPDLDFEEFAFTARDGLSIPAHRFLPDEPNGRTVLYAFGLPGVPKLADDPVLLRLLSEGYEVVRPAYRAPPGYGDGAVEAGVGECGRADVWDLVDCAVDWQSRFGSTDRRLALIGFSYGGYLALLSMTYPEAPWICGVALSPPTMAPPAAWSTGLPEDPEERKRAIDERSPVNQAHKILRPLLLVRGDSDTAIDGDSATSIQQAVQRSGHRSDVVTLEGRHHSLLADRATMFNALLEFLDAADW
jgi:dienelactone hydrolase